MKRDLQSYLSATLFTYRNPGAAARRLMAMDLPTPTIWAGFALSVVLTALLTSLTAFLLPPPPNPAGDAQGLSAFSPFAIAALVAVAVLINNLAVWQAGKVLGGQGRFIDITAALSWVSLALLLLQAAHLLLLLVAPPLSALTGLASFIGVIVLSLVFIREAHGFERIWQALVSVLLAIIGVGAGLGMIVSLLAT